MRLRAAALGMLLFAVALNCWTPDWVRAEGGDLAVTPPLQSLTLQPAGDATTTITLSNQTEGDQTLNLSSLDFQSLDETGGVAFIGQKASDLTRKYGLAAWLQLPAQTITIPSGQSRQITVGIRNLATLAPGGHYGAVVFEVQNPGGGKGNVAVRQQLASLLFVDKKGGERFGLGLAGLVKPKQWGGEQPVVTLRFHNTGNVHVVPRGTVELIGAHGRAVYKGDINIDSGILLPETYRQYPVTLSRLASVPSGMYHLVVRYRYDTSDQYQTVSQTVYVYNAALVAGAVTAIFAIILLVVASVYIWRRRRIGTQRA